MEPDYFSRRIADLDNNDKPREKALNLGVEHLTNTELMAIILGSGLRGMSVIDLAQEILKGNENKLSRVARMSINELCTKFKGIGVAKAISIKAAIELGSRCVHSLALENEEPQIRSSKDCYDLMRQRAELLQHEQFWILFLSQSNRVKSIECISKGGLTSTVVDVKIILKMAIDKLAQGLILVHNHPSGNLSPSLPDDNLTKKINDGAKILDIKLLDHIIISSKGYYSYNDEGRI